MKVSEIFDPYKIHNLAKPSDDEVTKVDKVEDLASILKAQCSDILKAYKEAGDPIYRGMRDAKDQVIITGIRPDRKPVEMKGDWHEILHTAFLRAGLKATRKNAIFCTTSKRIAEDWGTTYIIFPKNGWTVTVFSEFKTDYTFHRLTGMLRGNKNIVDAESHDEKIDYIVDELEDMGRMNITTPNQLAKIITDGYEDILLTGSSYIAVKANSPLIPKLEKLLDIHL